MRLEKLPKEKNIHSYPMHAEVLLIVQSEAFSASKNGI